MKSEIHALSAAMQKAKIILFCTAAAVAYGIVHDQVTVRLCVEYFTIAHPPLFHATSPAVLGLCWGIAATCGVGALLGVVLAEVSQSAGLPPTPIRHIFRPIGGLLAIMAISASLAGLLGFELSRRSIIAIPAAFKDLIPASRHDRFMAVWFAHAASYLVGLAGGLAVIGRLWRARGRPRIFSIFPRSKGAIIRTLILAAAAAFVVWIRFFKP
jgi:hypothetical protein